ncbi:MAG: MFS transporter [Thermovirgaceae bacterium]
MQYFRYRFLNLRDQASQGLIQIGRGLRSRNYRLFFFGQSVSLIGIWMQRVALSWLVYRLTDSPVALGLVDFIGQIPVFALSLLTGLWIDHVNLRTLLLVTQALALLQAILLAALTLTGSILYWHIIVLSAFLGVINAFDMPGRQAFVIHLVERRQDLGNAIALNSSLFNIARLVGPSVAGMVIAMVGEGICFLLNGASFLTTLLALKAIKLTKKEKERLPKAGLSGVVEGLVYAFGHRPIKAILLLLSLLSFTGLPYLALMPVFAKDILKGGPQTLGLLLAASGLGALVAGAILAARDNPIGLGKTISTAAIIFGVGLSAFAVSPVAAVSTPLMVIIGFGFVLAVSSCNTLLQTLVEDSKRGRVMSLYVMSLVGIGPIGSLAAGYLARLFGAQATLFCGGLACLFGGILFARRLPFLRSEARKMPAYMAILAEEEAKSAKP